MTVELRPGPDGPVAVLIEPWSPADADAIARLGAVRLRVAGFADLDFLREVRGVEELDVLDLRMASDRGAADVPTLRKLSLETYARNPIDFTQLPLLERLSFNWRPHAESVFASTGLTSLRISALPRVDLTDLRKLVRLKALRLDNSRRLSSLRGLEDCHELRVVSMRGCSSLEDISALASLSSSLEDVELDVCRKLRDVTVLAGLSRIKRLSLVDCGPIPSLAVIEGLHALEEFYFYGTTVVEDGDMTPLLRLPALRRVAFAARRHYSHREEDVTSLRRLKDSPQLPSWVW